jgi:hypothetical protein
MPVKSVINVDLANVWAEKGRKKLLRTLTWGDEVTVLKQTSKFIEVEISSTSDTTMARSRRGVGRRPAAQQECRAEGEFR